VGVLTEAPLGRREPDRAQQRHGGLVGLLLLRSRWCRRLSVICRPIFTTGLSEVIGSWKTMAISLPQISRISLLETFRRSLPWKRIWPAAGIAARFGRRFMTERESTVLPDPDSPTIPIVLPCSRVKETPSTALTMPRGVSK
jgi:hypothetical protein